MNNIKQCSFSFTTIPNKVTHSLWKHLILSDKNIECRINGVYSFFILHKYSKCIECWQTSHFFYTHPPRIHQFNHCKRICIKCIFSPLQTLNTKGLSSIYCPNNQWWSLFILLKLFSKSDVRFGSLFNVQTGNKAAILPPTPHLVQAYFSYLQAAPQL